MTLWQNTKEWRRSSCRRALITAVDGLGMELAKKVIFYFAHM